MLAPLRNGACMILHVSATLLLGSKCRSGGPPLWQQWSQSITGVMTYIVESLTGSSWNPNPYPICNDSVTEGFRLSHKIDSTGRLIRGVNCMSEFPWLHWNVPVGARESCVTSHLYKKRVLFATKSINYCNRVGVPYRTCCECFRNYLKEYKNP